LSAREPTAEQGAPELGRSHLGRLVLGYGRRVTPHAGTDDFGIYPDQRVKRIAGLFETLFRYNGRSRMGGFLHRLQGCCAAHGARCAGS